jgi:hypothetical protein
VTRARTVRAVVTLATIASFAAGCGDDDDDAGGDVAAYCAAVAEVEGEDDAPTVEQIEAIRRAAPEEIRDDVEVVADRFVEAIESGNPDSVFTDEEVTRRLTDAIEPFEEEHCPNANGAGDAEGEGGEEPLDDLGASLEREPDAAEVAVRAVEYDFEFQPPLAGRTTFVLRNEGEESHFMVVARFAEGVTFEEAFEADGENGTVVAEAESGTAAPGAEAVLTVDLEPADYAMLCFIPSSEGEVHAELGMAVPFTVQ